MNVIHIGKYYYPYKGGIETYIKDLAESVSLKSEVIVSNTKNKTETDYINGIKVIKIARLINLFSLPINPKLPIILGKSKASIYHLHLPNPTSVVSYLVARPKGKLVITWHSDIIKQRFFLKLYKPFLNKILKRADTIIATSSQYVESSPHLLKHKYKCSIIPLGIDTDYFRETKDIATKAKMIKEKFKRKIILFVGRLIYYKGVKYLIKAMKNVDANLLILGFGKLEKKLKIKYKNNNIHFLGRVYDLRPYYAACDVFVLPSIHRSEAFGMVQMEAMAFGKPVISTKLNTGVEYVNQDGKTGIIVEPQNSLELRKAIIKLLNDERLSKKLGSYARDRVQKKFTKEIVATKVFNIYQSLYGK